MTKAVAIDLNLFFKYNMIGLFHTHYVLVHIMCMKVFTESYLAALTALNCAVVYGVYRTGFLSVG